MKVGERHYRSIWVEEDGATVGIIDQTRLPFDFAERQLHRLEDAAEAIAVMRVRGAPLIGATAAYGICLAMRADPSDDMLDRAHDRLLATRPTAVNLRWALDEMRASLRNIRREDRAAVAYSRAAQICDEDVATNEAIGRHALTLFLKHWDEKSQVAGQGAGQTSGQLNILTHCNAGWLATVDWGTALAPIYMAHDDGIPVHVWVDETRPRNQGAQLTAWEMVGNAIPHHLIVDNAGGHLMQHGQVDLVIVGTDRTTAQGDVCNKIGTYLKALAAADNNVPFYVALPSSTIDWTVNDGVKEIPIEERDGREVTHLYGRLEDGSTGFVQVSPDGTPGGNPAFDVTPARMITGLITERGVAEASAEGLLALFPERRSAA